MKNLCIFFLERKEYDILCWRMGSLNNICDRLVFYQTKENKCVNMLSILNQKISDRNIKNENGILNLNENLIKAYCLLIYFKKWKN